jgi:hypothetical protein
VCYCGCKNPSSEIVQDQKYVKKNSTVYIHNFADGTSSALFLLTSIFITKDRFTLGIRANVQPKSSIPIGTKVEIGA